MEGRNRPAKVAVLRLGHRLVRDERASTHLALVARAFGAERLFTVDCEDSVIESVKKVNERWGGNFGVAIVPEWRGLIREWKAGKGLVVHLTMYGEPINQVMGRLKQSGRDVLVVVGAEKVPRSVFQDSDYNISLGSQPHSEIAALALFLDRYFEGRELDMGFEGARIKVIPSARGKKVLSLTPSKGDVIE